MLAAMVRLSYLSVLVLLGCVVALLVPVAAQGSVGTLAPFSLRNYGGPPFPFAYGASSLWAGEAQFFGGFNDDSTTTPPVSSTTFTLDFGFTWSAGRTSLPGPCAAGGATQVANQLVVFCGVGAGGTLTTQLYFSTDLTLSPGSWSGDSVTWQPRKHFAVSHFAAPFDGYGTVILTGGYTGIGVANDVVSNEVRILNGNQHYVAGANAPWPARYGHTTVMDADQITMIMTGGQDGMNGFYNDVWSASLVYASVTGVPSIAWNRLTAAAAFAPRFAATMWSINSYMYLAAGGVAAGSFNDIWVSADYGQTWQLLTGAAGFLPRQGASAVVSGREVLLYGGAATMTSTPYQDVWVAFQ